MRHLLLTLLCLASPLAAHEYRLKTVTIDHPFAYEASGPEAEGYVILVSEGPADRLLGIRSDRLTITLSTAPIAIPAGGAAELLPGGAHIDFTGLQRPWVEGDQIPATLIFENAGEVPIVFYVEPRAEG